MSEPLKQLAGEIAEAHRLKFTPSLEAIARWKDLVEMALAAANNEWLSEPAFRLRTGASSKWCRAYFDRFAADGLAKKDERGRRVWNAACRPPAKRRVDAESRKEYIIGTFKKAAS